MKITTAYGVVDVTINPGRKSDGRPNAGMEYTASLRCSSEGAVRLTLATDFTPPCVLAVLPEFDFRAASAVIAELGIWAPAVDTGWTEARPGVYAFADGVRFGEPTDEELEFMAGFGFTPGARFDLALPMLRAQRAELKSEVVSLAATEVQVRQASEAIGAAVQPEVGGGGVPMEPAAAPTEALPEPKRRRRAAAQPVGKVEIVSQVLGESTEQEPEVPAAVADVFDVLDAASTPEAKPAAVEANPFMIEGL